MRYGVFSALGAVALLVLTLALPAQLADADTQSGAAPAYEALRDGSATRLRIHETDAHGASQAALYDAVEAGDLFEWREADGLLRALPGDRSCCQTPRGRLAGCLASSG